jgi:hypothetical protein
MVATLASLKMGRDLFLLWSLLFLCRTWSYIYDFINTFIDPVDILDRAVTDTGLFFVLGAVACVALIGLIIKTRRLLSEWKAILICVGCFALGLAFYLYIPVAAMTNPPEDWNYARSVEGFNQLVVPHHYDKRHCTEDPWLFLTHLPVYWNAAWNEAVKEFGLPYLLIAGVPLCFLKRFTKFGRRWLLALVAVYASLVFFTLVANDPSDSRQIAEPLKTSLSATYIVLAVLMGYGLILMGSLLTKEGPHET